MHLIVCFALLLLLDGCLFGLVFYLFTCYVLMFCVGLFGGLLGVCLLLFESGGLGFGCLRGFCGVCCLVVDWGLMTVVWGLEFWFGLFGWFVLWFVLLHV